MSGPDFAAMGLLEGLDPAARAGRLALLETLYADGCPVRRARGGTAEGRLALLPAERSLGVTGTLTVRHVAAETGVDPGALRAARRATAAAAAGRRR